jgi:putative flippase GtrA
MNNNSINISFKSLLQKFVNRETIAYGVAGVLTTLVNFVSYEGLYRLGIGNLTANALAWVIAVTFAYFVNKNQVFLSKSKDAKDEAMKLSKFFGARIVTLVVEQAGMFIFTEKLKIYRWLVKGGLAVIVIILNYLFSKLFIFKTDQGKLKKES